MSKLKTYEVDDWGDLVESYESYANIYKKEDVDKIIKQKSDEIERLKEVIDRAVVNLGASLNSINSSDFTFVDISTIMDMLSNCIELKEPTG